MSNTEQPKVLIAVPSMDQVAREFCMSLALIDKSVANCTLDSIGSSLIYDARNKLAKDAIKADTDWILWLDSDMVVPPDVLERLLKTAEENEADIVSGLYFRRAAPFSPVAFDTIKIDEEQGITTEVVNFEGHELKGVYEVDAVGFGCVLTSTQVVFEMLATYKDCFSPLGKSGEDISFCHRAKQLGFKILLDCDIKCGHVGHIVVTEDIYKAMNKGDKK